MEQKKTPPNDDSISKILFELSEIKKTIIESIGIGDWINRKQAMRFLSYQNTAMTELEKTGALEFSQVGRRKFFRKSAIIDLIQKNIQKNMNQ